MHSSYFYKGCLTSLGLIFTNLSEVTEMMSVIAHVTSTRILDIKAYM